MEDVLSTELSLQTNSAFDPVDMDFYGRIHQSREGMLYMSVRAISAIVNLNYDGWPAEELEKSYKTFINDPIFVDHHSAVSDRARGMVIDAQYVETEDDQFIDLLMEIDYETFPALGNEIVSGGLDSVSMGADVEETECSVCGNIAFGMLDICDHVKHMKGEVIDGSLVYEICRGIDFYEISLVFEPADITALAKKVVASQDKTAISWNYVPQTYKVDISSPSTLDEPPVEAFPYSETNEDESNALESLFKVSPYTIIDENLF